MKKSEEESRSKRKKRKPEEVVFLRKREDGSVFRERSGHTIEEFKEMASHVKSADAVIDKVKSELAGISEQIEEVRKAVFRASQNDNSVLILGETGTGKEIVARQIHENSKRAEKSFVVLQPAGLPENLVDAELFGSSKHAYTDAIDRPGLIEAANGGTLFIDEIGDLPPSTQSKLLRTIQFKTYRRLGEVEEKKSHFRLICATNQPLLGSPSIIPGSVSNGPETTFRSDLYYRIAETVIEISSLRERREDVLPIFLFLIERHFPKIDRNRLSMSWNDLYCLLMSDWPGNVRELENLVKRRRITQWKLEKETVYAPFGFLEGIKALASFDNDRYDISEPGHEITSGWGVERINVVRFTKTLERQWRKLRPPYWKMAKDKPVKSIYDIFCFDIERILVDEGRKLEALPKYRERREKYQRQKELEREKKEKERLLALFGRNLGPDLYWPRELARNPQGHVSSSESGQRSEDSQEGGHLFSLSEKQAITEFNREWLRRKLERNDWSVPRTAKEMKITLAGLHKKMKKLNLRIPKSGP